MVIISCVVEKRLILFMNSLRLIMRDYLLNAYEVAKICLGASESGPLGGFVLNNFGFCFAFSL